MSHFGYTRAAGVWAPFTVARASELASLDAKTYKAINGDEGGTWAPSSPIWIGGQGVYMNGPLKAYGAVAFEPTSFGVAVPAGASLVVDSAKVKATSPNGTHSLTIDNAGAMPLGTWQWGSSAWAAGTVTIAGDFNFGGMGVTLAIDCGHLLVKTGSTAAFAGPVTCVSGSAFEVAAGATADLNGTTSIGGTTTITGAGHVNNRVAIAPDADTTYSVATVDEVIIESITAYRVYTLSNTGAADGSRVRFVGGDGLTANVARVEANAGALAANLKMETGSYAWCEFVFSGGAWHRGARAWHP